jgi:hypothetical protein
MDQVDRFLSSHTPEVRELATRLRALILSEIPGVEEQIDEPAHLLAYGFGKKYSDVICTLMPYKSHVNLGFYRAVDLPDPAGLLEGTGKLHRHVKIRQLQDVDNPALAALLQAAMQAKRSAG